MLWSKKKAVIGIVTGVMIFIMIAAVVQVTFTGDYHGIYLMKGNSGKLLELTDDIFLGGYERVIAKVEWEPFLALLREEEKTDASRPRLKYEWNQRKGHGHIISSWPDGKKFLICFSRYIDSNGNVPSGIFVGGGLPFSSYEHSNVTMNETGMAYFDGQKWQHIWCNVNESIASAANPSSVFAPSDWEYLGSKVAFAHDRELILKSSHKVMIDGALLRIDRIALYQAGDRHFVLVNKITNTAQVPTSYFYLYGDEPWVGDYGTSVGNVGWVKGKIYNFEGTVNPSKYSYAGMYDYGNKVILGGQQKFSGLANFLDWGMGLKPDLVYFSNRIGTFAGEKEKVPLYDKSNRVIFAQWGPRALYPGQSDIIVLAIGMADNDPKTGFPLRPEVKVNWDDVGFVLGEE